MVRKDVRNPRIVLKIGAYNVHRNAPYDAYQFHVLKVNYVIVWLLGLRSIYSTVMMSYDVEKLCGYIV